MIRKKVFLNPYFLVVFSVFLKLPVLISGHIQEDSFITWKVAKNLLSNGVLGFNGTERLSASTTHLYVMISAFFQMVFADNFIIPLLLFSCILFAVGSIWLSYILFSVKITTKSALFILLVNIVPPALTASCLGMEYGILFFLFTGFLYFGIYKNSNIFLFVFPILLLWTRLDTAIFLSVISLFYLIYYRKINFYLLLGGVFGLFSVLLFNYYYFGDWINHTIIAKQLAYKDVHFKGIKDFAFQMAYYGGFLKKAGLLSFSVFVLFLGFIIYVLFIIQKNTKISDFAKKIILALFGYSVIQIFVFVFFKAFFDWYYWIPRFFLFSILVFLAFTLDKNSIKSRFVKGSILAFCVMGYVGQVLQSYAIAYMENTQRKQIVNDLLKQNPNPSESIFLEPAGKIPFYTGLYTYDEVGLVNKKVTDEMKNDEKYWWRNTVLKYQPNYILSIKYKPDENNGYYKMTANDLKEFKKHYEEVKEYPIDEIHNQAPKTLKWIYKIRPIGKNYYLYKRIK